jgi:hypothetical protein
VVNGELPRVPRPSVRAREEELLLYRLIDEARGRRRGLVRDQAHKAIAAAFLADALGGGVVWWAHPTQVGSLEPWQLARVEAFDLRRERVLTDHIPQFRDIAGNPFRPVGFDPAWRTEAVVSLARGMDASRDFIPMPVLADALEDAGCTEPDILAHCRGTVPHARGCWVVDLVLGKT